MKTTKVSGEKCKLNIEQQAFRIKLKIKLVSGFFTLLLPF